MFLWVKLVFQELRKCASPAEIRDKLQAIPRGLNEEYSWLFAQLISRVGGSSGAEGLTMQLRRARSLFVLLAGAAEPLSMEELRHAYAMTCSSDARLEGPPAHR